MLKDQYAYLLLLNQMFLMELVSPKNSRGWLLPTVFDIP